MLSQIQIEVNAAPGICQNFIAARREAVGWKR